MPSHRFTEADIEQLGYAKTESGEWVRKDSRLAAVSEPKSKRRARRSIAKTLEDEARGKGSLGEQKRRPVVTITSFRIATLDDDNLRGGLKTLRDCIAAGLDLDDAESIVEWRYHQVKVGSRFEQGTLCVINQPLSRNTSAQ